MDPTEYLRFAAALIFVLALIGAAAFALRAFGFMSANRAPADRRMSVVEVLDIDARRRVVIVRRDNVEHLLLLGAQSETVIERGIKVPDISTEPIPGTTFLTIRPEPRL